MAEQVRRGGRWWWLAIIGAFILVISGSGTAVALWSAQVKDEDTQIGAPVLGFAVIANEQTYVANLEGRQDTSDVPVDFSASTAVTTDAGSAVVFQVSMLASPGYEMDYSIDAEPATPVFFPVDDPSQCTPDNVPTTAYVLGESVAGIQGSHNSSRTDLWCAVLAAVPGGTYANTVTVEGIDANGAATSATSTWEVGVAGVSNQGEYTLNVQPIVGEEGQS